MTWPSLQKQPPGSHWSVTAAGVCPTCGDSSELCGRCTQTGAACGNRSQHRWRVWDGHWRPLTGGAAPSVLLREDHGEWSRGARQVSTLRCSHRWSLHVLLWFWVWLYCYPHSSPVFDQALVGTPVVCQPSSSLPADELTYYMRLPWQGDHLPVAIFKIKIRFLKTSSSRYSWKLRPTATMQIRTCPVPQSYQQWAGDEPHSLLSAGLSGRRREILKGTFKTFPKAYTFWCHFLLLSWRLQVWKWINQHIWARIINIFISTGL